MTTISYAQNFEDVMLLRALSQVPRGLYIDVGAQHPVHGSVTKAFYERGWRGINVEPVAQWFAEIVRDRPEDVNLKIAISHSRRELELYEVSDTGLSTSTERYAEMHQAEGRAVMRHLVPCRTLDEVIAEYAPGEIHFLKVDVEGAEGSVLKSISLDVHRPWILVIEATEPNSQRPAYQDWEPRVLASGYDMVYEDGLNRFYLARERMELKEAFRLPPNYFDSFVLYSDWCVKNELEVRMRELEVLRTSEQAWRDGIVVGELRQRLFQQRALHRLAVVRQRQLQIEREHAFAEELRVLRLARDELSVRSDQSTHLLKAANAEIERLRSYEQALIAAESELVLIKGSLSWHLTRPLRLVRSIFRGSRMPTRRVARATVRRLARLLVAIPGARAAARGLLSGSPGLKQRLFQLMYGAPAPKPSVDSAAAAAAPEPDRHAGLSRSASEALDLLKQQTTRLGSEGSPGANLVRE